MKPKEKKTEYLIIYTTHRLIISPTGTRIAWENIHEIETIHNGILFKQSKKNEPTNFSGLKPVIEGPDYVFVQRQAGKELYEQIYAHWQANYPVKKLQEFTEKLISKYQFTEEHTNNRVKLSNGTYNNLKINCEFTQNYPFNTLTLQVELDTPSTSSFFLMPETSTSKFKRLVVSDINVDHDEVDAFYLIKGSNTTLVKELFNTKMIRNLLRLINYGQIQYSIGTNPLQPTEIDQPEVLDTSLLNTEGMTMLHFEGTLLPENQYSYSVVSQYIEICLEMAIQFSEVLRGD